MSDTIMLFGAKAQATRPASDIIKSSIGFEKIDGAWFVSFSTIENRKGYGKQRIPLAEYGDVIAVLQNAVANGIQQENEELTCIDVVRQSLLEAEDGSVRFKTEGSKGKKPTLFTSMDDFAGAVEMLAGLTDAIAQKAKTLK